MTCQPGDLRRGGGLARAGELRVRLGEEAVVRGRGRGVRRDFLADGEHQAFDLLEVDRVDQRIVIARRDTHAFEDPEPVEIGEQFRRAAG